MTPKARAKRLFRNMDKAISSNVDLKFGTPKQVYLAAKSCSIQACKEILRITPTDDLQLDILRAHIEQTIKEIEKL